MEKRHLCRAHKARLKANESEAVRVWSELMQRGVRAYVECRVDTAEIYLSGALDIAVLRSECNNNHCFNEIHIKKPSEFLVQLLLANDSFDAAFQLVHSINQAYEAQPRFFSDVFLDFIGKQLEHIEIMEKSYFKNKAKIKRSRIFESLSTQSLALN